MPKKSKSKPKTRRATRAVVRSAAKHRSATRRTIVKHQKKTAVASQKAVKDELRQYLESLPIDERKAMIADALETMVYNTTLKQRAEIATHIVDVGIELLGITIGVETENAMVLFPTDGIVRLIDALDRNEKEHDVPIDDAIEGLIATLGPQPMLAYN